VVNVGDASRVLKFAQKYDLKEGGISIIGRGTVNSRVMEFLGLNEVRREIVHLIVKRELAAEAMEGISKDMELEKPGNGIAFSCAISEFIDSKGGVGDTSEIKEKGKSMYQIIHVIVDRGRAEEVINAASKAGAKGGTIINAKSADVDAQDFQDILDFFPWKSSSNKEEVLVITKREYRAQIVESIRANLKIDETGNGILFVLDIDEIYGLRPDCDCGLRSDCAAV